jgi:hypothetical protein
MLGVAVAGRDDSATVRTHRLLVPDALARTAATHQQYRLQLNALRRQRVASAISGERGASSRRGAAALILIHDSRVARDAFHDEVAHFVTYLEGTGAPLRRIIDHVRGMLDALRVSGVLYDDGGAMADELARWIIEDSRHRHAIATRPRELPSRSGREARVLQLPLNRRAIVRLV